MTKSQRDSSTGALQTASDASTSARSGLTASSKTVRDPNSGRFLEIKGAGSLSGNALPLRKGVDLTKPIYEQVSRKH